MVGMEKWGNIKYFSFPSCVWLGLESLLLVEKKNEKIDNGVCINLLTCPYYKIRKEKGNQCVGGRGRWVISHLKPTFSPDFLPNLGRKLPLHKMWAPGRKQFSPPFSIPPVFTPTIWTLKE